MTQTRIHKPQHFVKHGPVVTATPAGKINAVKTIGESQRQLADAAAQARSKTTILNALFDTVLRHDSIQGCIAFERQADGKLLATTKRFNDSVKFSQVDADAVASAIAKTAQGPQQTGIANSKLEAICWPVAQGKVVAVAVLVTRGNAMGLAEAAAISQLLAAQIGDWHQRQHNVNKEAQLTNIAAILDLVQRVESTGELEAASFEAVASIQQHLQCERVALALTFGSQVSQVRAISGVGKVDPHATETLRIKAALDESIVRGAAGSWPPSGDSGVHQLLAHKNVAGRDGAVLTAPLTTLAGQTIGAIGVFGGRELIAKPQPLSFVRTLAEPLATALDTVQKLAGGRLQKAVRLLTASHHANKRRNALIAMAIASFILLMPLPYKVRCGLLAEPVERRFCVAPHDGLLESTFVEPGDVVEAGDLLARMDGRETRWEIAGAAAQLSRAAKQRDTHMAAHETPKAVLAELEMKQLESQSALLNFRASNLEVRAPRAGIVLAGSLDRRENYPVSKGQVLYEIAPLDEVRVEIAIPAEEVNRVRPGMKAILLFEGLGNEEYCGEVKTIRPRAEIRDDSNVFVAELVVANPDGKIRPGMRGRGKIVSQRRPLAWIWFHRAWEKVGLL